jgi:hypothetical protein
VIEDSSVEWCRSGVGVEVVVEVMVVNTPVTGARRHVPTSHLSVGIMEYATHV